MASVKSFKTHLGNAVILVAALTILLFGASSVSAAGDYSMSEKLKGKGLEDLGYGHAQLSIEQGHDPEPSVSSAEKLKGNKLEDLGYGHDQLIIEQGHDPEPSVSSAGDCSMSEKLKGNKLEDLGYGHDQLIIEQGHDPELSVSSAEKLKGNKLEDLGYGHDQLIIEQGHDPEPSVSSAGDCSMSEKLKGKKLEDLGYGHDQLIIEQGHDPEPSVSSAGKCGFGFLNSMFWFPGFSLVFFPTPTQGEGKREKKTPTRGEGKREKKGKRSGCRIFMGFFKRIFRWRMVQGFFKQIWNNQIRWRWSSGRYGRVAEDKDIENQKPKDQCMNIPSDWKNVGEKMEIVFSSAPVKKKTLCNLVIHGGWPANFKQTKPTELKSVVPTTATRKWLDATKDTKYVAPDETLRALLEQYWPGGIEGSLLESDDFWRHEWERHGVYGPWPCNEYFNTVVQVSIDLLSRLDEILGKYKDGDRVDLKTLHQELLATFGHEPSVKVKTKDGIPRLEEIRFRYDINLTAMEDHKPGYEEKEEYFIFQR